MTPSFVVDASIAMSWCFLDEATRATQALFDEMRATAALVPGLWYLELVNVLAISERTGRIDAERVAEFIETIENFEVEVDDEPPQEAFTHILPLCRKHQLSSYDATYLELAVRKNLPLASLDGPLRKVAKKLGVKLLGK